MQKQSLPLARIRQCTGHRRDRPYKMKLKRPSRRALGRPVTVDATVPITANIPATLAKALDEFAVRTGKGKGRSDAIRRLLEAGLKRPKA